MGKITEFFSQRHMLANLLLILVVLLGLSSLLTIRQNVYPEADMGFMTVTTTYPGASAEDVELNVTNKLETELSGVMDVKKITSVSLENLSMVTVYIDPDSKNKEKVKNNIRNAVSQVNDFPKEVDKAPLVMEHGSADVPMIQVGISGDATYAQKKEYARILEKKIRNIPGVARLDATDFRAREIQIEVNPEIIKQYQIPVQEIIQAIQKRNIRMSGGKIGNHLKERKLVTMEEFDDPYLVEDVIVRSSFEGPSIRVKDLAIVNDTYKDPSILTRINGESVISFTAYRNENGDIVKITNAIKQLVQEEKKILPEGIGISLSSDFSLSISKRFQIIRSNALIGLALVLLILTLFIDIRTSFWVAMGIPFSLLGTIALLPAFGVHLDSVTLSSMIMVLGIIVDDAIIISENIYSHREKGKTPLRAVVDGISEVAAPVVTSVVTTLLVFLPMLFIPGDFKAFVRVIPITITLALMFSLLESFITLPAHILPGLHKRKVSSSGRKWFKFVEKVFAKASFNLLKARYLLVILFISALAGSLYFAADKLGFILFPSTQSERFFVVVEMPSGTSLKTTSEKVVELEKMLEKLPENELVGYTTTIGKDMMTELPMENMAYIYVDLTALNERERTADEIVSAMRDETENLSGFSHINYHVYSGGPPVGKAFSIQIVGSNDALRQAIADSVTALISSIDGVRDIDRNDKAGKEFIRVRLDYDKLAKLGLSVDDVAQNVRIAYDGEIVTQMRYGEEDVDFRLLLNKEICSKPNYLQNLQISNKSGRLIRFVQIASFEIIPGTSNFHHYKGERAVTIESDIDTEITTAEAIYATINSSFDLDRDYPGIKFTKTGEMVETTETMTNLIKTFIIALIGIYFVLILLFNSFTKPFLIITAIPFGITGVIVAFILHGEPMSFFGSLGVIALSGIVVNDSLVLVNHIDDLRKRHPEWKIRQVVTQGATNRLRPIIMTTATTVAGLLPLVYGWGGTDSWMAPMALAIGYGLLFATFITLSLIPSLYLIANDFTTIFGKLSRKKVRI